MFTPLNILAAGEPPGGEPPGGEITAVNVVLTNQPAPGNVNYSDGTYLFNAAGSTVPPQATHSGIAVGAIANFTSGSGGNLIFAFNQTNIPNTDAFFTNVQLSGLFTTGPRSVLWNRADVFTYNPLYGNLQTSWAFAEPTHKLVGGEEYLVEFDVVGPTPDFHSIGAVAVSTMTVGFVDVVGLQVYGTCTPAFSSGVKVARMTYGGSSNAASFSLTGNLPNTDATFVRIEVTGQFVSGTTTKTLTRPGANFYGYQALTNETAWGYPDFADGFVAGRTYELRIFNRTPGNSRY